MLLPTALASGFASSQNPSNFETKLFFCGDVMLARGVDQILPYPTDGKLYEGYMKHAKGYVDLVEEENGPLPKNIDFSYIWGEALNILEDEQPDARIINLENAITHSKTPWPNKGIHYKMSPQNAPVLLPMKLDCCVLSNNHVLDWGYPGLTDTIKSLQSSNIQHCGAGENISEAQKPAIINLPGKGRVLVFGIGSGSSGVMYEWGARKDKAGVWLADPMDQNKVKEISSVIAQYRQDGDIVVLAIHWGSNWGYDISSQHTKFAHMLIDSGDIDIIHGHSSHHPRAAEVYKGKVVMYGCGEFINDYEGIGGHEEYGKDLTFKYFVKLDSEKKFHSMDLVPLKIKKVRLNHVDETDFKFMKNVAVKEYSKFGLNVTPTENHRLKVTLSKDDGEL